ILCSIFQQIKTFLKRAAIVVINEVTVKQFGGGNGAAVDQTASNSSVNVTQVGFGNNATAHQY
ncbi:hypothetical protein ACUOA8_26805, partial [Escherichia sp. SS-MK2]